MNVPCCTLEEAGLIIWSVGSQGVQQATQPMCPNGNPRKEEAMQPEAGSPELWKITLGELDEKMGVKIVE